MPDRIAEPPASEELVHRPPVKDSAKPWLMPSCNGAGARTTQLRPAPVTDRSAGFLPNLSAMGAKTVTAASGTEKASPLGGLRQTRSAGGGAAVCPSGSRIGAR